MMKESRYSRIQRAERLASERPESNELLTFYAALLRSHKEACELGRTSPISFRRRSSIRMRSRLSSKRFLVELEKSETEQRLYELDAWRETPFYTEREQAALAWTEALTLIANDHVPREVYEHALTQFSEPELINLTLAAITINSWNRLCIAFRRAPGDYQPVGIAAKHKSG